MWNKFRNKTNPYILAFIVFIFILVFIDMNFNGIVAEFITGEILDEVREVEYLGIRRPMGILRWEKLKYMLVLIALNVFILFEISVYYILKLSKKRNKDRYAEEVANRIRLYSSGGLVNNDRGFKEVDLEIEKLLNKTEEIRFEKEMEVQKKKDLVTYLAHDLKTPLTVIIGYLSLMSEAEIPSDYKEVYLRRTLEKAYHLEDLTNQFFDITRFDLQEIPLNMVEVNLNFFINQIIDEIYPLFKEKNLDVDLDLEKNLSINMDANLMARVLNNLFKNAINYSYEDTTIKVRSYSDSDHLYIEVENQGDSLNESELDLVFKKFYRREKERNQSAGSGLGLAIARSIVEKHKGDLRAESCNNITRFIISLSRHNN